MELSGSGGGQALLVAVGVHSEAAVAAAPVVAVGGKTVRETRNCQSAGSVLLVTAALMKLSSEIPQRGNREICDDVRTLLMHSGEECSTPGHRHCRTGGGCRRNILWRRGRGLVSRQCSVEMRRHRQ